MIVIAGTGRSGTSFLAKLYAELGFNIAGKDEWWGEKWNAGVESLEVNNLLIEIMRDLAILGGGSRLLRLAVTLGKRFVRDIPRLDRLRRDFLGDRILLHDMDRFEQIVEKHRPRILEFADQYDVIKAPGFCRTLSVWAAAGAKIDVVLVALRKIDDVITSMEKAGFLRHKDRNMAYNHYAHLLGYLYSAIADYNLNAVNVRFPDFLHSPETLYQRLPFPSPIAKDAFLSTFHKVRAVKPG